MTKQLGTEGLELELLSNDIQALVDQGPVVKKSAKKVLFLLQTVFSIHNVDSTSIYEKKLQNGAKSQNASTPSLAKNITKWH